MDGHAFKKGTCAHDYGLVALRLSRADGVQYFHSAAMKVSCEVYRDERSGQPYIIPDGNDIDIFRAYIETLPTQESPEIFGLHPNADLTFRTLQVRAERAAAVPGMQHSLDEAPSCTGHAGEQTLSVVHWCSAVA